MKKLLCLVLSLALPLSLAACGESSGEAAEPAVELTVFAAASLTESLDEIIALYKTQAPQVVIRPTYDSSGTLKTQIENGADCDLFLSAAPKQMNALDGALADDSEKNPDGLDFIDSAARIVLLENKVVLAVPDGNPGEIQGFDQLALLLAQGDVLLAMGNSDVPVGQYTQKIFAYYGLEETDLASAGVLTYGSNVKEVVTQVAEAAVDCGVVYATDAASAGLMVVDEAGAEMCGQVIYPAAPLKGSAHPAEAAAFLDFLTSDTAMDIFQRVGFSPAAPQ